MAQLLGGRHLPSRRAAPCMEGGRPGPAPPSRSPGATRGPPCPMNGARSATATPDLKAGSLGWAQRGGGALLLFQAENSGMRLASWVDGLPP